MSPRTFAISILENANSKEPLKERGRQHVAKAIEFNCLTTYGIDDWLTRALHPLIGWFKWAISSYVQLNCFFFKRFVLSPLQFESFDSKSLKGNSNHVSVICLWLMNRNSSKTSYAMLLETKPNVSLRCWKVLIKISQILNENSKKMSTV